MTYKLSAYCSRKPLPTYYVQGSGPKTMQFQLLVWGLVLVDTVVDDPSQSHSTSINIQTADDDCANDHIPIRAIFIPNEYYPSLSTWDSARYCLAFTVMHSRCQYDYARVACNAAMRGALREQRRRIVTLCCIVQVLNHLNYLTKCHYSLRVRYLIVVLRLIR
jgi:hypothetical protein